MSEFFPTKYGADAVLRGARRRRTAKASATGSSALLVAVALVLTTGAGPNPVHHRDELVTTTPSATPAASGAPSALPTARPGSMPSASRAESGPTPTLFPSPAGPGQTAPPLQHRTTTPRKAPITRSSGTIGSTDLCTDGLTDDTLTWCIRVLDPGEIKRGHTVSLGAEFCLYPTSSPMTLDFASTVQIDLQIENGSSKPDWYAGEGYRYTKPGPSVTVAPGQCLVWHSPWDTRDAEGFVEPPGTYTLDFMVLTKGEPPIGGDFAQVTVVD